MSELFDGQTDQKLTRPMIAPLGDSAVRIDFGNASDSTIAARVAGLVTALSRNLLPGVTDVVSAYSVVVVHYDSREIATHGAQLAWERVVEWVQQRSADTVYTQESHAREVLIPVCYGRELGPDIEIVASRNRLSIDEVIQLHSNRSYNVRAVGFLPGFPYLENLPAELTTPRRPTPRTRVPAGSVAIGGTQTGVYPFASPGGWNLIGRTPLRLFRAEASPAALLHTGDQVRFRPIERAEFEDLELEAQVKPKESIDDPSHDPAFEVLSPGAQTTVQDLGRPGHQFEGVTPGGAMDSLAARAANLLVGNEEGAAFLEAVGRGPKLRALRDAVIALTGANVEGIPGWRPLRVTRDQVVDCTSIDGGARFYLAVSGGLAADFVLKGRGTDLAGGFGGQRGRAIASGDRLYLADIHIVDQTLPHDSVTPRWYATPRNLVPRDSDGRLRILWGPQSNWFSDSQRQQLLSATFVVTPSSNRMGIRLRGPSILPTAMHEMTSEPMVHGAIQMPPDGQPILLGADRQTIGGYPTIACVISVDLPLLGQLRPGSELQFAEVTHAEAESLIRQCEHNIAVLARAIREHE
jgi:KipI family sensor histidine kinase inhibitor